MRCGTATLMSCALAALLPSTARGQSERTAYEEMQTFSAVLNQVRLNYVDSVAQSALVRAAIAGALDALDPHSRYLRRATLDRLNAVEAGLLGSTGARLELVEGAVRVLAVGPRSPAAAAGMAAGDRLVAVNDTPVAGLSDREAEALLAGEAGSRVRLELWRGPSQSPQSLRVVVRRAVYRWPAVSATVLVGDSTGYVAFTEFAVNSAPELDRAIENLRRRGAQRLILDLRGNPGGLVSEAGRVAALFLPNGSVFQRTEGRKADVRREYRTEGHGDAGMPLIVLIDDHSASASEAVAGALQDHDRALIAGRRSFGKALMQTYFPLPSGDALALTVGRLTTPRGRSLQRDYRGLTREQYRALAGQATSTPDSARAPVFSVGGRPLDPGPGVAPDVELPAQAMLPVWWPVVLEHDLDAAIADAVSLPDLASADQWESDPASWDRLLVAPLLERASAATGLPLTLDAPVRARVARELAARVALARWGEDGAVRFRVRTDPDIRATLPLFARLPLAGRQ